MTCTVTQLVYDLYLTWHLIDGQLEKRNWTKKISNKICNMLKGKVHYIGPKVKQKVKPIFDLSLENKFSPDPFYGHLEEGGGTS